MSRTEYGRGDDRRRYSSSAVRSMQRANQLTLRYNHEYLASEHLLGGLLGEETGTAAELLRAVGADPDQLLEQLGKVLVPMPDMATCSRVPWTPCLKQALASAAVEADGLGHSEVDARHLLLGLAAGDGIAAELLRQAGVGAAALRQRLGGRDRGDTGGGPAPGGNGAGPAG